MVFVKTAAHFASFPGGDRIVDPVVAPERVLAPIYANGRLPLVRGPVPEYADSAARVVALQTSVPAIFPTRYRSKIGQAVVHRVSVDVIDELLWPRACVQKPDHSVREIIFAEHLALKIAARAYCPEGFFARVLKIPSVAKAFAAEHAQWPRLPKQLPGGEIGLEQTISGVVIEVSHSGASFARFDQNAPDVSASRGVRHL